MSEITIKQAKTEDIPTIENILHKEIPSGRSSMTTLKKTHTFQYHKAEQSDIETLTELLCELYEDHSYEELFVENKEHFDNGRQVFYLAFDDKKPIGMVICTQRGATYVCFNTAREQTKRM